MKTQSPFALIALVLFGLLLAPAAVRANIPGGGTGTGPDVTVTDNGTTVTLANGIVSILCTKAGATINQINYTYNNGNGTQTTQLLAGGTDGGQLYWELGGFGTGNFTYTLVSDPASNGGNYAEIALLSTSPSSGTMEVHFSMLRGSPGFYVTAIWAHRNVDGFQGMGETRDNIYAGSIFNWMSVDATRNKLMEVSGGSAIPVINAPQEVSLWTNGIYQGRYEDKYKYSADLGVQRVWGWSSVGTGGLNIGIWNISASAEYYNGGPMKRELMEHIGTTILNVHNGAHYGGGHDGWFGPGEVWTKVYGPYLIYCNNVTNTITGTNAPAQALYADALAQGAAEKPAWPYYWFTNASYAPASNRGTVTGQIVIQDPQNPNATAANLWVGVVQQPVTITNVYDFQDWMKPYQFWVQTDTNGNFTIPAVIAGGNYTLYAFGPGAAGTFQSQNQTGGNPPNNISLPAVPFNVTVTGGATNNLGPIIWTPTRVGSTVFEIGYPDRKGDKFRHGDDFWVGDIGPDPNTPSPIWGKYLEYPFDFPSGPNYTVGQSRWTTDWNYVQPVVVDASGNFNPSTSTINFTLPATPTNGAPAALYIALCSDFQGPLEVAVNGSPIAGTTGYFPAYSSSSDESDSTIREGIHGAFSDQWLSFPSSLLTAGANTITINMRKGGYFANHAMYDYIRLELSGYVPPPPSSVTAYAGNNCNLLCWPVTPGASSYNILRSTTSGSGYTPLTNGVTGPICGSGTNNAIYVDTTAANGTTYYYVVQSVNPTGASANSPQSSGTTPSSGMSANVPAAPTGLNVTSSGHQSVSLGWTAVPGANYYSVWRSVLVNTGGGATNTLGTIILNNNTTGTSYTDTTPTDGSIYSYFVTATSAGGTSTNSSSVAIVPLPVAPAAPTGLAGDFISGTNVVLTWNAVPGAVGYIVSRGTSSSGPFNFLMSVTETTYSDGGLNPALTYYYQVSAMNAGGVSTNSTLTIVPPPSAPPSLSAFPGNAQVTLVWYAVPGATGYYLYGGPDTNNLQLIAGNYSGNTYTNTSLTNDLTYYYYVTATNANGQGPASPLASATPSATIIITPRSLTWLGDGVNNIWNASGNDNWQTNGTPTIFNYGDSVTFDNTGSNNVPVALYGVLQPAVVTVNSSKNYTFNGPSFISGTNAFIKTGTGTVTMNVTNTYSGGTVISNGIFFPGNIGANSGCWGSGPIILAGGILEFDGYGGNNSTGWGGCTNPIVVPSGNTGTMLLPARWGYSSPFTSTLSGGGTLNVTVDFIRDYFSGDWSAFTGQINVSPRNGTGDFRINNPNGYANAAIYLNNGVNLYNINANNQTTDIGELGGNTTAQIEPGSVASLNPTWRIGAKNTTNTFAGAILDSGVTSLIKVGTGTFILSGANNTYSGGTTINGGTLLANNSTGTATGSGAVTVASGGTLGGTGIISGAVTVNAGGTLAPGNPLGLLTLSNNLTFASGSFAFARLQHSPLTNNSVKILGTLTESGTLIATNLGASTFTAGDSFKLFNAATYSGAFNSFNLPPLNAGLVWNTNLASISGTLSVVTYSSPSISSSKLNNGNLIVQGSGGIAYWNYYVLASTNLTSWTPIATNQFDAGGNFIFTNALSSNPNRQFYRLQLQ